MSCRVLLACLLALLLTACAGGEARRHYVPLELPFGSGVPDEPAQNPVWETVRDASTFRLRSQGSYLNVVDGRTLRTVHLQLEITRAREGALRVRQADLRLVLLDGDGTRLRELVPSEVWAGRERLAGALEVPAWSRRAYDLFFDEPPADGPAPDFLRLRWRWTCQGREGFAECSFRRLLETHPDYPERLPRAMLGFGMSAGFYLPGYGELGRRALRPAARDEVRQHYVFHEPGGWLW